MVIVGAGAVGCLLAARLSLAGTPVIMLARDGRRRELVGGLTLETLPEAGPWGAFGPVRVARAALQVVADAHALPPSPALVVVCVRAYQTAEAARGLAAASVRPRAVLTLQNGLGNAEALAQAFPESVVLAGTTTHGVTWVPPATVRHAGAGDTVIGPWLRDPLALALARNAARWLSCAGLPTSVATDPRPSLWLKVAVNAAINPPTAIHGIENGALLDGGRLEGDLRSAAREVAAVASAEGVALDAKACEDAALAVARRTARNRSSMLQARLAGRPLETDAITGEVVRRGRLHRVPTPVNQAHLAALLGLAGTAR